MNKMKKFALIAVCAALLVCVTIGATVAWLTSTDKVENTFTVGKVKITLDEADVNEEGLALNTVGEPLGTDGNLTPAERVRENDYHLLPGNQYVKDPIVHVDANSESCIVFVKVENGIKNIEAPTTTVNGQVIYKSIEDQMAGYGWQALQGHSGVYYKKATDSLLPAEIPAGENLHVFDRFMISYDADGDTLKAYKDAKITIKAYAIQYMDTTPEDAWELLSNVPETTTAP